MNATLKKLADHLKILSSTVLSTMPNDEPLNIAHGNWSFPGVTRVELASMASDLARKIEEIDEDKKIEDESHLKDFPRRIEFLQHHTVPQLWSNAATAVPNYLATLALLERVLQPALEPTPRDEVSRSLKRVTAQIRSMEARLRDLQPRSGELERMVDRIEQAFEAADQLPSDLEALAEARKKIDKDAQSAREHEKEIRDANASAKERLESLREADLEAKAVLARCESAYSAATSQGLAAAFSERSMVLARSMWVWVAGLALALLIGGYFGSQHLGDLATLAREPSASGVALAISALLSLLSVGGPVWFAWLSTKQIGHRFRLSEDYAFKASVSRAYEGYRREAARVDKDMEADLLRSALSRLDELPLRLVEDGSHGSPVHELLSSDVVRSAASTIPGFTDAVRVLAENARSRAKAGNTAIRKPAGVLATEGGDD